MARIKNGTRVKGQRIGPPKGSILAQREEDLDKGIKELAAGASMFAALANPSSVADASHTPPKPPAAEVKRMPASHQPGELHPELKHIAQVESSGGKNKKHVLVTYGLNAGHRAGGSTGLMPITVKEAVSKNPVLKQKYGHLLEKEHGHITEFINKNPAAEAEIANSHWSRLTKLFGDDFEKKAFAWNQGITGAMRAPREKLMSHPYVSKATAAKQQAELQAMKQSPTPAMTPTHAMTADNVEKSESDTYVHQGFKFKEVPHPDTPSGHKAFELEEPSGVKQTYFAQNHDHMSRHVIQIAKLHAKSDA